MKKLFVLSSWSRIAAIGSIFMVVFLAACGDDDSWSPSDADNSRSSSVILSDDSHEGSSGSRSSDGKGNSSSTNKDESSSSSVILSSGEGSSDNKDNSSSEGSLAESSSSSAGKAKSSSSSKIGCKTETEDDCEYGELTDNRDGQTYKTVKIGDQWWMAENLNYETDNSFCYNDSAEYCEKYGRLYTWAAATDSAGVWGENGKGCGYAKHCTTAYPVRGVCPEGWHLPTKDEWNTLSTAVGGQTTPGKVLKSTSGWYTDDVYHGNGTDAFSFSALPAGYRIYTGHYDLAGYYAYFWSSTEYDSYDAYGMGLGYYYLNADLVGYDKYNWFSVRCIQD
jgi:uncharacterized protein (TIGR02145 family)